MAAAKKAAKITPESPEAFINRELSWLQFARRVLEMARDPEVPLLERIKFVGILGMLHDEFFMKRISGLKRQMRQKPKKLSLDGRRPAEEFEVCRAEILSQVKEVSALIRSGLRPELEAAEIAIRGYGELDQDHRKDLRGYFKRAVLPILTPLAVDAEHPFPFISNLGLNLAVTVREKKRERFIRIEVPANRRRWVRLGDGAGFVPLEQVIAANLDLLLPKGRYKTHFFRITRGAEGDQAQIDADDSDASRAPGSIIGQVTDELKARRFAGEVRLQVSSNMPKKMRSWLAQQLNVTEDDISVTDHFLGINDLLAFEVENLRELRDPAHEPATHPRLRSLRAGEPGAIFDEIGRGDILLHHPYHSFDNSVLRLLESAAVDDRVLAIKLTIYRTSTDSPIVRALAEAARRGKQVAVVVEITARFDEAPNIAWGRFLEQEGVHVSYGVEKLKTHVKLAMVVREEDDGLRRYVHVGTGNYHPVTARVYEDFGLLSCDPELSDDVAAVFNELTGATPHVVYSKMLVAPRTMRSSFVKLIRREAEHARKGRLSGVTAKMNQLQDPEIIRELYRASQAGVPITLHVRGLCCLRPGVPGLSETIRVYSVLGRFLEHARVYRFTNDGSPDFFIGSADWMKRNLDRRVETIAPVSDPELQQAIDTVLEVYESDNHTAWDLGPDGSYTRRRPAKGEEPRPSQAALIELYGR